ncbi:MAG: thiamine-phosphate kinase [Nitrososphaerota archaeon]|nr:thiamine-phosphate kinase [Nitrososphaerota archaeon]
MSNKSLGEHEIIRLIQTRLTPMQGILVPFGDDVSAINLKGAQVAVLKTDMLVGKTDVPKGMSLFAAARKAVVMNVSDFAAKGALPVAVLVAIGLPMALATKEAVAEIAEGLNAGAREYGAYVVGGDTNEASDLIISITLFGTVQNILALRRGAMVGDILAVTGLFGRAAAGLRLLLGEGRALGRLRSVLVDAVCSPMARLREGLALRGDYVSASIDSSDGLAWSIHELAQQSGVGFLLDTLPIASEAMEFAVQNGVDPVELVFYGGEEYELVLTVKPAKWAEAQALIQAVGGCLIPIGKATCEKQIILDFAGQKRIIELRGWEHFKG